MRDLRIWLKTGLRAESVNEAIDIIAQKIDNYKYALTKHGMLTRIGIIKQLFKAKTIATSVLGASAVGIMTNEVWSSLIFSSLHISANIYVFIKERKIEFENICRKDNSEVAILYDAQKKFGE